MNGRIEAKLVKATEVATTFLGFGRCGMGKWTNGDVLLVPTYAQGARYFVASDAATGENLTAHESLVDAVNHYGKVG